LAGNGPDHRNRSNLRKSHPGFGHDVGRDPELALPIQKIAVLLFDLSTAHGRLTPTAS
jgi:hypothetical protein